MGILKGAVDSFEYFVRKGNLYTDPQINPKGIKQLFFLQNNGLYQFEFGMIAKNRGIYAIGIPDAFLKTKNGRQCEDEGVVKMQNANINNHLYYYRNLYYQGAQVPAEDSLHGYCFKVK